MRYQVSPPLFFGCTGSSLLRAGFLQLRRAGATLHGGARASQCGGFSSCGAQALGSRASVVVAHRLSSCGAQAQLLCGLWDLPGPGIEPVSPALTGRFLTSGPPGKAQAPTLESVEGIRWWVSGQDSTLPLQGTQIQSLVGELRSCMQSINQSISLLLG